MAGKTYQWTPERRAWLIATVREQIATLGRVDWKALARDAETTYSGVRCAYTRLAMEGTATPISVLLAERQHGTPSPTPAPAPPAKPTQTVEDQTSDGVREVRAFGQRIKTVDDLLAHIEADMDRFEIDRSEATKNEQVTKNAEGEPVITEYFRVFVRLKPKAGPSTQEQVEAMLDAAFAKRRPLIARPLILSTNDAITQELIVADAHIGRRSWPDETGGAPYDTPIAERLIPEALGELMAHGKARRVGRRAFRILGDWSNHDTAGNTTTAGTQQDSDSRLQKILDVGAQILFDAVEASARECPTVVMFVPGNHDEVLTWAFQKIVATYFRQHPRVTVDMAFTHRKYDLWGKTLLGFAHGDKARKKLPGLMALECREWWGASRYREIHTGHLHSTAAVETLDGVITRTAPSIAAIDGWHAREGYVGALRGMETYYYHRDGALAGMDVSCPEWRKAA